jgi:hypothetical protein
LIFSLKNRAKRLRVCIATVMGGYDHARVLDGVLAQALKLRGADVDLLLCDKAVPACQMVKIGRATPEMLADGAPIPYCDECISRGREGHRGLSVPLRWMSSYLTEDDIAQAARLSQSMPAAEIPTFAWEGLPVGEHAYAGTLRYFARGDLNGEPHGEAVLRRYLEAGLRTIACMRRLIETHGYDVLVVNHGIYIPQGMICEVARAAGVRVVTYNPAYRKHSFIFSHDASYHFTMLDEPVDDWRGVEMTPELTRRTSDYLDSRRHGGEDWIWFHDQPQEDVSPILSEIGCDPSKPYVVALTSVVWDAQLHYKSSAFAGMLDWLKETVSYWRRRPDVQLVIRVHPAELRGMVPSRQRAAEELSAAFPELPPNVFVIGPEHQASTYALCEGADAVVIYNTKTGIEAASMGVPVIVAGEAWVRGKGFTLDVSRREDYFALLDTLPLARRMSGAEQALAMKYAFHFFFRRMIPLPFIHQEDTGRFRLDMSKPRGLAPGRFGGLDTICDGILRGAPFIYPAESLEEPVLEEKAVAEAAR